MKITINRRQFLDLLSVAGSVAKGTAKEVTSQVKIHAVRIMSEQTTGTQVELVESIVCKAEATDGEIGLIQLANCEVSSLGKCLLHPGQVASILGSSSAENVTIEADGQAVTIAAGSYRGKLPYVNPDEFPSVKGIEGQGIEVPASALLSAIRRTMFACDPTSTRYQLGGVLLESDDEILNVVATDGRRMSAVPVDVASGLLSNAVIVPHKSLGSILKTFSGSNVLSVKTDGQSLQVASEAATVVTRLVEGRYPNWRSVMPADEFAYTIPIQAGWFATALKQASVTTLEDTRGVELAFELGSLTMRSKGQDKGSSEIEVPVDTSAKIATTVDWRFVLDFAREVPADDVLELRINDKTKPIVLSWGSWKYVVMPMSKE